MSVKKNSKLEYWQDRLNGEIPVTNIPTDYKVSVNKFQEKIIKFSLEEELSNKIDCITEKMGVKKFDFFLSLFYIALSKKSGQEDIIVEILTSENIESNIIDNKHIPIRNYPASTKYFSAFLKEVNKNLKEDLKHKNFDFTKLLDTLAPEKTGDTLSEVFFNYIGDGNEIDFKAGERNESGCNFLGNMFLEIVENTNTYSCSLKYNCNAFEEETIDRFKEHFINTLKLILHNYEIKISDIDIISEYEKELILNRFNDTKKDYMSEKTIYKLFEEQVIKTPNNIAVIFEDRQLTYKELNDKSNQLARVLREKGVKEESVVGIMLDRSLEMIVGIMGILKAGGAYLPIATHYPIQRIEYMAKDSKMTVLLSQEKYLEKLSEIEDILTILNVESDDLYKGNCENLVPLSTSKNLAYVIYTSGSTGKPKGVMIEHHSVINRISWMQSKYPISPDDVILQKTPYTFDVSVWEIFWWSFVGAKVCMLYPDGEKDPDRIINAISKNKVTTLHFVPSMLNVFLDYIEDFNSDNYADKLSSIKQVFCSGEALHVEQADRFNKMLYRKTGAKLANLYGPTEATVDVSYFDCSEDTELKSIPIGKPIDNIKLYVLNKEKKLQPIGIQGELYISGVGVARGYLNNPTLTAEKFIENPFVPGEKMYKTGDLAKWNSDGNIEYLGRIDHQVKIRGFRIELGEIEKEILKFKNMKETVVIDRLDNGGNRYLCGYIVSDVTIDVKELKDFLNKSLIEYMVPPYIIQLSKMPLTDNGKLDRKKLPEPNITQLEREYIKPSTELEIKIESIWSEILGLSQIGVTDNFLELGGHSLKAISIVSKIRRNLKIKIKVADIFENPTIQKLSQFIEKHNFKDETEILEEYDGIKCIPEKEFYETSFVQKRMYAINQIDLESINYNEPEIYTVYGNIDKQKFENALQQLINRHESLRTSFHVVDGEIVQKINKNIKVPIEYFKYSGNFSNMEEYINKQIDNLIYPFNLSKAPLIRLSVIELDDIDIIVLDIHHIVTDGISSEIIIKELVDLYEGKTLDKLEIQYKDFAHWQNNLYKNGYLDNQEKYWLEKFKGDIPVLNMPTDYSRPAYQNFNGNTIFFNISADLTTKLDSIVKKTGTTRYMLLATAFMVVLSRYSGQDDIVIGTPSSGRSNDSLNNIVGMFVNSLAIRNKLNPNSTFIETLNEVKNTILDAFENQDYDFANLVEKLNIKQEANRNPIFDIMFSVQDFNLNYEDSKTIKLKRYLRKDTIAKLDMTVIMNDNYEGLIQYKTKLFKYETITRFIDNYKNVLNQLVSNIDINLNEIEVATEKERDTILNGFNNTKTNTLILKGAKEMFEETAKKLKDKPALISKDGTITYKELNERANQIAHLLRKKGIGRNNIIGILCDRTIETAISMIAVIKSGAAYLPIDNNYPQSRKKYMIEDSKCKMLLGNIKQLSQDDFNEYNIETLVTDNKEICKESIENLESINELDDLMYTIYTSGSTGKPKGVCLCQRGLINRSLNCINPSREDRILQVISLSFDPSVLDIWKTLLNGKELYIASNEEIMDLNSLENVVKTFKITSMQMPSALFANVVSENVNVFNGIKELTVGGDVLSSNAVAILVATYPDIKIINAYGPTENTIISTEYVIEKSWDKDKTIPIGKPINDAKAYIVDKCGKLCPIGVPGELLVGGVGVAKGYLDREELTKDKFIDNPFVEGESLYKTGDLAKWLEDGNIDFLGRIDNQVKIRGFRIELGEIQAELLKDEKVKEALVIENKDNRGVGYLCAYVTSNEKISSEKMKKSLSFNLPDYMIPAYIIQIEGLPMTSNGKIDTSLLPKPDLSQNINEYIEPINEQEQIMADIWGEVLGIDKVGTNYNFYDIGGDSIKAIQIVSRLTKHKIKIEVKDILKYKTIKTISNYIKKFETNISQDLVEGEIIPTPIIKDFTRTSKKIFNHFNQSMMIYSKKGFDENNIKEAMNSILTHHDALRMILKYDDNKITLYNNGLTENLFGYVRFDFTKNLEYEKAIEMEAEKLQRSIDVEEGPLVKLALFKTKNGDHLLFVIHHLVIDGMSWRILFEDFSNAYRALEEEREIKFPLKTTSFKDWAKKQYEYANSSKFLKELEYWNSIIPKEPLGKMPKYNVTDEILFKDMNSKTITLDKNTTKKLLRETNRAYNTEINDILLSSLGIAVKEWSGINKVAVTLEGHGRENIIENIDITRTIGWFTSCFPVVLDLTDNDLASNIKRNKEILKKVPNKGIGFGMLKHLTEDFNKNKENFNLKTEISFNYLGQFDEDVNNELFEFSNISSGTEISPEFKATDSIQINSMVQNGELKVIIEYNTKEYTDEVATKFIDILKEKIELVIRHCSEKLDVELTPTDYGINDYTLEDLEEIRSFIKENVDEDAIIESINKLIPIQEGMLYTYLNDKNTTAYVLQMELEVKGKLDLSILNKAYNELLNRYSILRTVIFNHWKHPAQIVIKNRKTEIIYEDFSEKDNVEKDYQEYAKEIINKGFDLSKDVLFKVSVVKTGDKDYKVVITAHHIIIDGWSNSIIINELFNIYNAIEKGESIPKENLRYEEYLAWLSKQNKEEGLNYWKEYLDDYNETSILPAKKNTTGNYKEGILNFSIDKNLSEKLDKVAVKCDVTLNTVYQVAWGLVLQKYTSSNDVVFGTVVSGRSAKVTNIEKMVGMFINTIPARIKADDCVTILNLLQKVQQDNNNTKKYEHIALSEIQEITPLRDQLIQNIMVFENYPIDNSKNYEESLIVKELKSREQTDYPLNISFEKQDTLKIQYMYNKNIYDDEFIEQLTNKLISVFKIMINNVETSVKDIEKVDEIEKRRILIDFNNTKKKYKNDKTVKEVFEEQVIESQDKTAIVSRGEKISYRELNEKANQIARLLKEKGVGKGTIVPIICDRSLQTIVLMVATIKSGGAYLPIDEEYPKSRIRYMLEDSKSKILLAKESEYTRLDLENLNIELLKINDKDLNVSKENLEDLNGPDDLAYVIYTSGSTGNPKGVCCKNRGLINLVKDPEYMDKKELERVLQSGSLSFDASVFQIWITLLNGGEIHLEDKSLTIDEKSLQEYVTRNKITFMLIPTPLFNQYSPEIFKGVKALLVGGDVLSSKQVSKLTKMYKDLKIINGYGPTENSVASTMYGIIGNWEEDHKIPIGTPIQNSTAYVMDLNNKLLPIGIAGELYVGGDGIAKGYLNRSELTKEKFIENPYKRDEIIYKTGDLVKWLPDGNLDFIGRVDNQVKINGFRIELGEIEAKLLKHNEIKDAVVIDRLDSKGNKYLCGYIVALREMSSLEIKEFLRKELPNYMIPSYIMQLKEMPLTPNGKTDRKALPKPDLSKELDNEYVAPRNDVEEKLANAWSEVLGIEKIGVKDNFYDIGGDSIKSMQIVSRIRKYGIILEIKDILEYKTIEVLSKHVKKDMLEFSQGEVKGEIELTPIMKKFIGIKNNVYTHFNQSMIIHSYEGFDDDKVQKVMKAIVSHHDILRSVLKYTDTVKMYNRGIEEKLFDFAKYDLREISDFKASIEIEGQKIQESMNTESGPLVKLGLFKTQKGDYLLFVIHHLVIDGMSWRILFEDFYNGYSALQNGQEIKLPPKTTSFKEWAKKQVEYAQSPKILAELEYWNNIVPQEPLGKMPKYNVVKNLLFKDMQSKTFTFNKEITNKLLKDTNRAYNTEINDILLSILGIVTKKWSGNDKVAVMLEGHGRENIIENVDINRTIGWFTSCYPVVLDTSDSDIGLNIKRNKEILRKIPNKGIGYGILRYLTQNDAVDIEKLDIKTEISFNYLGQFNEDKNNSIFKLTNLRGGRDESTEFEAISSIQINSLIQDDQLTISIDFNKLEYSEEVVDKFIRIFKENLVKVVDHCSQKEEVEYTPTDYGINDYTLEEVDELKSFVKSNIDNKAIVSKINKLSPMQEGMLYTYLKNESSNAYVLQLEFNIHGELDLEILKTSYEHLLHRHDILRSIIYSNSRHSAQVVLDNRDNEIYYEDLTHEINTEEACKKYVKALLEKGFALDKDILFKLNVAKLGEKYYRLIISIHHIIVDGWSNAMLINDLFDTYERLENGEKLNYEISTSYSEYIKWLYKQDKQDGIKYWAKYLNDYNQIASLPKKDNAVNKEYNHRELIEQLDIDTTRKLQEISNKYGVTLNTICQTAWGLLLQKYTNSDDVVFGMVMSGRPPEIKGIEESIGIFLNTIPIRINAKDNEIISDLLKQVQNEVNMSNKYQYIALSDIQDQSELRQNLIQHITVFENYPESNKSNKKSTIKVEEYHTREQTSYDLDISFILEGNLKYRVMYNESVYENEVISNITKQLKIIFEFISENVTQLISTIEILDEDQKKMILTDFNDTKREYESNKTIKELFEEQVIKSSDKIAIISKGQKISYKELNEKSNQVAHTLKEKGIGKNSIVPVICDKSMETIVSMLAIIKAGGAYLPIDEEYPELRIRYMIEDSGSKIMLAKRHQIDKLNLENLNIRIMEIGSKEFDNKGKENLEDTNGPDDLAYIIYTSGSTGNPKGVCVGNKNIIRLVRNQDYMELDYNDKILQTGSIAFDASTFEIWGSLINGLTLYVAEKDLILNQKRLKEYLKENSISIMFMTTALFHQLCNIDVSTFDNLKYLLVGGEALDTNQFNKFREHNNSTLFINLYGPTENTTYSTSFLLNQHDIWVENTTIPIGKPISNSTAYVMDKNLRLLPPGVPGELCVGGDGLARGYLNREDLTREKFVENPYVKSEKIYRTGDLVRWLPDGNIEFLGRIDYQVKIRGFRIELGEIEREILKHEKVKEAVVIDRLDKNEDKYLCGYIVGSVTQAEIKEFLKNTLPSYMIPTYIIELDSMPITGNGKIDRKLLPVPNHSQVTSKYIPPRDEIEEKLVDIWSEVLGVEKPGITDNFFELGGHSLKATNVLLKILNTFNVKIKIEDIFEKATVEEMAAYVKSLMISVKEIDTLGLDEKSYYDKKIEVAPQKDYYELSSAQKRMYAINQLNVDSTNYNVPGAYLFNGKLDINKLQNVFNEIIARHESLRTKFSVLNGLFIQEIEETINFKIQHFKYDDIDEENQEEIAELIQKHIIPFYLDKAPLIRVDLIELKNNSILFIDMHHIITDGVSMKIIIEEFINLYEGKKLEPVKLQYKDFSEWQNNLIKTGQMKKQKEFWLKYLSDDLEKLDLPKDYINEDKYSFEGRSLDIKIHKDTLLKIDEYSKEKQLSKYIFMLATLNILLNKYTLQKNIVIGTPVSGRNNLDLNNIVGMFVNTLPIKCTVEDEVSFEKLLNEVKLNSLQVFENQDYQIEFMLQELMKQGLIKDNNIFDVIFSYQYDDFSSICLDGTKLQTLELKATASKNELTIIVAENCDGLTIECVYDSSSFKADTIEELLNNYKNIIERVLEEPKVLLKDIKLIEENISDNNDKNIEDFSFNF
ncbi:non-ribosomal peptide synthetase [Clostridium sp. HBUAS56017]|uniref:non-ribosomal peptide synthetase n=1 Tax=Clostridium sp. HBUAS56017 TaxID=2571128 RepID=UPI001178B5B4|nr:non-ribosomal peptide synthetase [Clostridium sp. HBUAS56017]